MTNKLTEFDALLDTSFSDTSGTGCIVSTQQKLGYVIEPDKIALSFSRTESLSDCPRKFLLRELKQQRSNTPSVDFAYGHAFGAGLQEMFRSGDLARSWVAAGAAWDFYEFEDPWGKKKEKSFWMCLWSLELFYHNQFPTISQEYKLAYLNDKPGIEIFVYLDLGDRYNYQVHIDLILQNVSTGALCVAEIKTSGFQQQEAAWGNADQTAGYYAILEVLAVRLNLPFEPMVMYIVQQVGKQFDPHLDYGFTIFSYVKDKSTSLDFLRSTIAKTKIIDMYLESNYFPKRGSQCVTYGRPCNFYGVCDLESSQHFEAVGAGTNYESLVMEDVDFVVTTDELLGIYEKYETS